MRSSRTKAYVEMLFKYSCGENDKRIRFLILNFYVFSVKRITILFSDGGVEDFRKILSFGVPRLYLISAVAGNPTLKLLGISRM